MRCERKLMWLCVAIAALSLVIAAIWGVKVQQVRNDYCDMLAEERTRTEEYKKLANEREARIHELEKEIAADRK